MPEIIAAKTGPNTLTVLPEFIQDLNYIGLGQKVKVKITKSRNIQFLAKYWVLVGALMEIEGIQQEFKTKEGVSDQLKIDAGYCHIRQHEVEGMIVITKTPKSISIESMDETEFNEFYQATLNVVLLEWLERYLPADLVDQYADYFARQF